MTTADKLARVFAPKGNGQNSSVPDSLYRQPTQDCPNPELWSSADGNSSEFELGEFLYGLVRLTKPTTVIETGCYLGHTTVEIGRALLQNGRGHLHTCDTSESFCQLVELATKGLPVTVHRSSGRDLATQIPSVDLAFIDSGSPQERIAEIESLQLSRIGITVLHDARGMEQHYRRKPDLTIPTPRGLAIYRCPTS